MNKFNKPALKLIFVTIFIFSTLIYSCTSNSKESKPLLLVKNWRFESLEGSNKKNERTSTLGSIQLANNQDTLLKQVVYGRSNYYTNFYLPTELITNSFNKDTVYVHTGLTDSSRITQIYLNGAEINLSNKRVKDIIKLPVDSKIIKWNHNNELKIKILKAEPDFLFSYIPYIDMYGLKDILMVNKSRFYTYNYNNSSNQLDTIISLQNSSSHKLIQIESIITAKQANDNRIVYSQKTEFDLKPKTQKDIPISLPICLNPVKFEILLTDLNTHNYIRDTFHLKYVLVR